MKFAIETIDALEVVASGKSVKVDLTKLSADIVSKLVIHGLRQKVADAAAGAKKVAEESGADKGDTAKALMQKVVDSLEKGDWGSRQAASPVSSEQKVQRQIVKTLWNEKATDEAKAKFKDMTAQEQGEFLDALFAKQKPERQAAIADMVKAELEAQKKKQAMLASLVAEGDDI